MPRAAVVFLLAAVLAFGANFRLYLKDGSYHIVREYQVNGDRVRFYSVERSEWEEIPLSLTDIGRTEAENKQRAQETRKEAAELAAEEKFEREQRQERERVPQEPGVYLVDGKELRSIKQAESKAVSKKSRSVLKVLSPIPIVSGKSTVELDGEHSANLVGVARPEFYVRLANDERFGIAKMGAKKGVRVVQNWEIIPVTKELIETQQDVEVFRKQVEDGLYKIWPMQPLEPGEYAVIEYTAGKGNIQTWDFAYRPAR
ncbi:MAG TPA: hypothetical protein VF767_02620 [Bryobacteraceae bacterium]